MRSRFATAAAFLLAWLCCASGRAEGLAGGEPLSFRQLTPEHGLPAARVNSILQDSRRFIWFGTGDGLARYDGHEIRVYRDAGEGEGTGAWRVVYDAAEDAAGDLWLATGGGLAVWQRAKERFVHRLADRVRPGRPSNDGVRRVLVARDGVVWLGTGTGLSRLDPSSGEPERIATWPGSSEALGDEAVQALAEGPGGEIWIGTRTEGLFRLDPRTRELRSHRHDPASPNSIPPGSVTALALAADGQLWVATTAGLTRLDPASGFARHAIVPDAQRWPIDALATDREGRVWAGTTGGGLVRVEAASGRSVRFRHAWWDPHSLGSDVVRCLLADRDGDLWVGTYPSGVSQASRHSAAAIREHRAMPGLPGALAGARVWGFEEEPDGDLWVASDGGGLDRLDRETGTWTALRRDPSDPHGLPLDSVLSLARDAQGRLWIGTYGAGLAVRDPRSGRFRRYVARPGDPGALGSDRVWRIVMDGRQRVWVATRDGGVDRYEPASDTFVHYRHDPADPRSLANDNVLALLVTRAGELWAGTNSGLSRRDEATGGWESFRSGSSPGALASDKVNDLFEDGRGSVWVATEGGGLSRFDPATRGFATYRVADGLPTDLVRAVMEDKDGALWLSTNQGILRFDPETRAVRAFDQAEGVSAPPFNRGAKFRTRSGALLFGGSRGFVELAPRRVKTGGARPVVVLTRLEVFNQEMSPGQPRSPLSGSISETRRLEIPERLSVVSFQFAALTYRSPHRTRYEYRLEGFDDAWRLAGPERRATYTNLDPGRYRLHARATSGEGLVSADAVVLELTVVPPWWKTWWFRSLLALAFVVGLVATGWSVSDFRLRARVRRAEQEQKLAQEQKRAEEDLRRRERAYLEIFNSTQDAILLQDAASGAILDANEAAIRMFGAPKQELLRRSIDELSQADAPHSRQVVADKRREALAAGSANFEWISRRASGELFPAEVQLSRSEIGGENRVLAVVRDVTERKRVEAERLRLERQLLHAQQLESLGVLAGGIAHDFNNLLVAILGHADLARRGLDPQSPAHGNLSGIETAARRAADLSRQMLAYSGRGSFALENVHLQALVEEMAHLLQTGISKNAALRLELDAAAPMVHGDATQIRQIVMNLVINASEALAEQEGTIVVATGHGEVAPGDLAGLVVQPLPRAGRYVRLTVADTGCGMDIETQRRVFEPFFSTKFTGRGLGLSAVLGIVRGHDGALAIRSAPGEGTAFEVYFPAAGEQDSVQGALETPAAEWTGSGTVLLVDDEPIVRELAQEMLEALGFRVLAASDGREALAIFEARRAEIGLVLLDLTMPRMSGAETFEALRAIDPCVRVVLSSGYTEADVVSRFAGASPAGFVQKPYSLQELADKVQAALAGG